MNQFLDYLFCLNYQFKAWGILQTNQQRDQHFVLVNHNQFFNMYKQLLKNNLYLQIIKKKKTKHSMS